MFIVYQLAGRTWDAIAFRYFHHQCKAHGGEFIYRTVDNVEGVLQMRLRDPRDYFDRLRKGDIPEDPYGHTNWEAQEAETMFVNPTLRPYQFFEKPLGDATGQTRGSLKYKRYYRTKPNQRPVPYVIASELMSAYGFTWREEKKGFDKAFGVRRGVLDVVELKSGEVLATRIGFFIRSPFRENMNICPKGKDDEFSFRFIKNVLRPEQ
ncbi:MAG: hypothetical protein HONDAALG_03444 [Gammaproteobacteria bacterium]|nr:hypothetical protein [Gammaproteobacteria bacterium]